MSERESDAAIREAAAANLSEFMEHGPGLRVSTRHWVVGRDRAHGWVLLGGLGSFGVGEMWVRDDEACAAALGYDDAPEMAYVAPEYGLSLRNLTRETDLFHEREHRSDGEDGDQG